MDFYSEVDKSIAEAIKMRSRYLKIEIRGT